MENDVKEEKAVQVTLPDEQVVDVDLGDKEAKVSEPAAKDKEVEAGSPVEKKKPEVDEREKALNDLRRQYEHQKKLADAEREARKKAEEYARQQAQQVGYARTEVQDSNLKIILNAIDATEQAASNAERDYADAMAAGDYASAARAQRMIAQAESHLLQLQNGRQRLEESLQQNTAEGSVYEPEMPNFEPSVPQDPVEMYASKLAPKSAQWLREHPDAVNKIGKLTRAHQDAVEDGITPESPDYFRFIEGRLGYGRNAGGDDVEQAASEPVAYQSKKSMASAPVSSNGSISSPRSSQNGNVMTLSSSEVEVALLMEPELPRDKAIEAYARNKARLITEGKLAG
jgi:hypothetical protein